MKPDSVSRQAHVEELHDGPRRNLSHTRWGAQMPHEVHSEVQPNSARRVIRATGAPTVPQVWICVAR
jgi:hypothetical protein